MKILAQENEKIKVYFIGLFKKLKVPGKEAIQIVVLKQYDTIFSKLSDLFKKASSLGYRSYDFLIEFIIKVNNDQAYLKIELVRDYLTNKEYMKQFEAWIKDNPYPQFQKVNNYNLDSI